MPFVLVKNQHKLRAAAILDLLDRSCPAPWSLVAVAQAAVLLMSILPWARVILFTPTLSRAEQEEGELACDVGLGLIIHT